MSSGDCIVIDPGSYNVLTVAVGMSLAGIVRDYIITADDVRAASMVVAGRAMT